MARKLGKKDMKSVRPKLLASPSHMADMLGLCSKKSFTKPIWLRVSLPETLCKQLYIKYVT